MYLKRRNGEIIETKFDLGDLEKIKKLNLHWHSVWKEDVQSYYARACEYMGIVDKKYKYKMIYLHKIIMDAQEGEYIDHKNHDTLDNRKKNLKITSGEVNSINRLGANKNGTSGYRNVTWIKSEHKYIVQLQVDGKNKRLGKFEYDELEEAGKFAEKMRQKYYNTKYNNYN